MGFFGAWGDGALMGRSNASNLMERIGSHFWGKASKNGKSV